MKKWFILFALVLPFTANADDLYNGSYGSDNASTAQSNSDADAISGSYGNLQNNVEAGNFTSNSKVDNKQHYNTPGAFAPGLSTGTNVCAVSLTGAVSVPGFGASLGRAYVDDECNVRETLRLAASLTNGENVATQTFLRNIACQSLTMWDSMELTFNETADDSYRCPNPRPASKKDVVARDKGDRDVVVRDNGKNRNANVASAGSSSNNGFGYKSNNGRWWDKSEINGD